MVAGMNKTARIEWLKTCSKKERDDYYNSVASLGCIICKAPPALHHLSGNGFPAKRQHRPVIPLCYAHHQGHAGIHTQKETFQQRHGSQDYLLEKVEGLL
jgi:hypothetical protein